MFDELDKMRNGELEKAAAPKMAKKEKVLNIKVVIVFSVTAFAVIGGGVGTYLSLHKSGTYSADGQTVKYADNGRTGTVTDENGTLSVGDNVQVPADFPKDIPVYSEAKLTSAVSGKDGEGGYIGSLPLNANMVDAMAWFKTELLKDGWTNVDLETDSVLTVSNADRALSITWMKETRSYYLSVSAMKKSSAKDPAVKGETAP